MPLSKPAQLSGGGHGPIAIFISRKEGKIFVRQDFTPLFEAPVKIDRPQSNTLKPKRMQMKIGGKRAVGVARQESIMRAAPSCGSIRQAPAPSPNRMAVLRSSAASLSSGEITADIFAATSTRR